MKLSVAASCLLSLPIPTAMASTAKATKANTSPHKIIHADLVRNNGRKNNAMPRMVIFLLFLILLLFLQLCTVKLPPNAGRSNLIPSNKDRAQVKYMTRENLGDLKEAYSGSWWAPLSSFLRYEKVEVEGSQEDASFEMFSANIDKLRMTKDWLDLSVEHMSKWWKQVLSKKDEFNGPALDRVIQILTKYTTSRRIVDPGHGSDVPQQTLVVIAYWPYGQIELTKWSLAATIASHVAVGMGRIVVAGRLPEEEELVQEAFDVVKRQYHLGGTTEFSFCLAMNEKSHGGGFNIPKSSLKKLRHVLLGNANDDTDCWLGKNSTMLRTANATQVVERKWKYIFFTEQDILLSTRQSSLFALGEALEQGHVLAPHRLQPIPHGSDFKGLEVVNDTSRIIPAAEPFAHVFEVHSNNMSCCDAGLFKPMTIFEPYDDFWWMSGFGKTSSMSLEAAHKHLLLYPFMRLTEGTNVVFVGTEHGRLCYLHFGASVC